jgi:hypothetical protein
MNDLVLFKLDGNKLNDTNRFVEPPMGWHFISACGKAMANALHS